LYTPDEIAWLPESVTAYALGLGNPIRYADLQPGEVDIPSVPDTGNGTPPIVDMGAHEARKPQISLPLVLRNIP
jgi:hypothetical protein